MSIVYKHTFPNGKIYIGITSLDDPAQRWKNGQGYNRNNAMRSAIKKYGWNNIKHDIVFRNVSREDACRFEQELISLYQSNDRRYGYNFTSGGEKGCIFSEESKRKLSNSRKGQRYNIGVKFSEERKAALRKPHPSIAGKNNPAYGRKWTKEELAIRQAHRVYARGGDCVNARAILQFSLANDFIREWSSIAEASRAVCNKTSIKNCLSGKYKRGGGYIWKYKEI